MKVLAFLCCLALARAGIIGTYSSAPVSSVYSSVNAPVLTKTISAPIVTKTISQYQAPISYTKTYSAPAPVYESVLSTYESKSNHLDGSQQNTYSKALDTAYASVRKFDSRTANDGVLFHPTVHAGSVISQPQLTYSVGTPLVHTVSSPVTYTSHTQSAPVVVKTVTGPAVTQYSSPVVHASSGLTTYASHSHVVQPVKITYSEAPLVSHMTFHGLGASYSW